MPGVDLNYFIRQANKLTEKIEQRKKELADETVEAKAADGIKVGYLPQEPQLDPDKDVLGNAMEGVAEKKAILDRYNEIAANYSDETADEMTALQDQIDAQNLWELDRHVEVAMDALRLPPGDADVTTLSGGERRRVALCRLLLQPNDMLLLDEPTNHLDAESVAWLEQYLKEFKGCVVAVTHDLGMAERMDRHIELLDGRVRADEMHRLAGSVTV